MLLFDWICLKNAIQVHKLLYGNSLNNASCPICDFDEESTEHGYSIVSTIIIFLFTPGKVAGTQKRACIHSER